MIPKPPKLEQLPADFRLVVGEAFSTIHADMDFETYSSAGFYPIETEKGLRFVGPHGHKTNKGLPAIGMRCYAEHESTEILSLAYDLKDGKGKRLWVPGMPAPLDLFEHFAQGKLMEAQNVGFEQTIWEHVAVKKLGWPPVDPKQWRCSAAKARAFGLPGALGPLAQVLNTTHQKEKDGSRLLKKFSMPRVPTKKNPSTRIHPSDDLADAANLYRYNVLDIATEGEVSSHCPDLNPAELEYWLVDQKINRRGVGVDSEFISAAIKIIEQTYDKYQAELPRLTGGAVQASSEVARILQWSEGTFGKSFRALDDDIVQKALSEDLPPALRRVLEIRSLLGSASVKKLYALERQTSSEGRVHDLFTYHGARTGRASGSDAQPQNFPNSGPAVAECDECGQYFNPQRHACPSCGCDRGLCSQGEWTAEAMEQAIEIIKLGKLSVLEDWFGDALKTISGCLRGAFVPAKGHDFISSDYSAIEAVVAAALSGEQWRLEAFAEKKDIYLASISKMTGIPYEQYIAHKEENGSHHPHRKLGKVAELASGYGGWIGAWVNFGADKFFDGEAEIKKNILAWRDASPTIVEMWGGQRRGFGHSAKQELYGLEGMAVAAVLNPGRAFEYRGISYKVTGDVLYCTLPSGRKIAYHSPKVTKSDKTWASPWEVSLSYMGWNTNPKMGGRGWVRMGTYGGKLFENVVQAVARDIMTHATVNAENGGYPVVLHVHDELVSEVPEGCGSVEELEAIMAQLPAWAKDWPIRAAGGWRAKSYRKD